MDYKLIAVLLCLGCTADPRYADIKDTEPACSGSEDCADLWHAVTYWVVNNSENMDLKKMSANKVAATLLRYNCYNDLTVHRAPNGLRTTVVPSVRYSRPNGPPRGGGCDTAPVQLHLQFNREIEAYRAGGSKSARKDSIS